MSGEVNGEAGDAALLGSRAVMFLPVCPCQKELDKLPAVPVSSTEMFCKPSWAWAWAWV